MKVKYVLIVCLLSVLMLFAGCATDGGPTGPTNAPTLSEVTVSPAFGVNPGEILVFFINFTDINGDLNGGNAIINDDQGFRYDSIVSNAEGLSGTLSVSITLSPLLTSGDHLFSIVVFDRAGNQSNLVYATVLIL
jgi:hypothetical protein